MTTYNQTSITEGTIDTYGDAIGTFGSANNMSKYTQFVKDLDKKKHTNYYLHEYFTCDEMVRALDEMLR